MAPPSAKIAHQTLDSSLSPATLADGRIDLAEATRRHLEAIVADQPPSTHLERVTQQLAARHAAALDLAHAAECALVVSADPRSLGVTLRSPALRGTLQYGSVHEKAILKTMQHLQRLRQAANQALQLPLLFVNEQECRQYLVEWHRSQSWTCQRCSSSERYFLDCRSKFQCQCRQQYPLTMGTIFNQSHVPLLVWFSIVVAVLCQGSPSSTALAKRLGYSRVQTVRDLIRKVDAALQSDNAETLLAGLHMFVVDRLPQVFETSLSSEQVSRVDQNAQVTAISEFAATTPSTSDHRTCSK